MVSHVVHRNFTDQESASMNGFLNISKPRGLTSRRVVDLVNQSLRRGGIRPRDLPKVGHAGTLDPLATGVLVVCLGAATRLTDLLHLRSKTYRGTFLFGRRSDTDDTDGNVVEVAVDQAARLSREHLDVVLAA